jgi:diguanylate cyclase (GGDEF)-like protein/PAS domain S-box-containing protein
VLVAARTAAREAARAARASERRLRDVLEALDEGVIVYPEQGAPFWNSAAERVLALTGAQIAGRTAPDGWRLVDADGRPVPTELLTPARAAGARAARGAPLRLQRADGTHAWLTGSATPVAGGDGAASAVVATVRDVTVAQAAARAVAESEARFRGILENLHAVAVCLDLDGCLTFANPFLYALSGWPEHEVLGEEWFSRFLVDPVAGADAFGAAMAGEPARYEAALRARDGGVRLMSWDVMPLRDADGRVTGVAALGQDVTEDREAEAALRTLSERDALTGLLNRRGFEAAVARTQGRDSAATRMAGLLALDLDGFKPINDTHGHAEGDEALRAVGQLLQDVVRGVDHAARLGGDEFAIYLADLKHPGDLALVVARLERALAAHNDAAAAAGRPYRVAWSLGAVLREPGEGLPAMLRRADAALYREKRAHRVTRTA